ncbi:MAG: hypothetical protein AAF590_09225 [Pseudomonadota bacterium]
MTSHHWTRPFLCVAGLLVPALLASPLVAEDASSLDADRYVVVEMDGGILRIDRDTGEVSECEQGAAGWVCRLTADDRLAYEAEINRLDAMVEDQVDEIARLEEEIAALESSRPVRPFVPEDESQDQAIRERLNLPSDEELDAIMDTAEEAMSRFFGMVERLRDDVEAERGN